MDSLVPLKGSLIFGGIAYRPPALVRAGYTFKNWLDDPRIALDLTGGDADGHARAKLPTAIIFHTTSGRWPQPLLLDPSTDSDIGERNARYWSGSDKQAGAHFILDTGKQILQTCDPSLVTAYHAGTANGPTIGIELVQMGSGAVPEDILDGGVLFADELTALYSIPRQIQAPPYSGHPIPRVANDARSCYGIYGHRDVTEQRGRGDPGDRIFEKLAAAGYDPIDFKAETDRTLWRFRQAALGVSADGYPGPATFRAAELKGLRLGQYVSRPGDEIRARFTRS